MTLKSILRILSIVLMLWGLRMLHKPGQWWVRGESWTRGLSLALLGSLMLAITFQGFLASKSGNITDDGVDYYWFAISVGIIGHLSGEAWG